MTKIVNVLVEGQAEEQFIKDVLAPNFYSAGIYFNPIISVPKNAIKGIGSGGNIKWPAFERELRKFCHKGSLFSTFIDFYALNPNFPGFQPSPSPNSALQRVKDIETAMAYEVNDYHNFIPYIQLHEFEALCFASEAGFRQHIADPAAQAALCKLVQEYPNPEDINEGRQTAPSKRIKTLVAFYQKPLMGRRITETIGLPTLRAKCPHFNEWLTRIETHPG